MRQTTGKYVIVGIFFMALAASVAAIGYRHLATRHALAFWGTQSVELINRAPQVTALRFVPPVSNKDLPVAAEAMETRDASEARGILNIRQALIEDKTFHWNQPSEAVPNWDYGLRFSTSPEASTTVMFASASFTIGDSASGKTVQLDPRAGKEFKAFFEEQFDDRKSNRP